MNPVADARRGRIMDPTSTSNDIMTMRDIEDALEIHSAHFRCAHMTDEMRQIVSRIREKIALNGKFDDDGYYYGIAKTWFNDTNPPQRFGYLAIIVRNNVSSCDDMESGTETKPFEVFIATKEYYYPDLPTHVWLMDQYAWMTGKSKNQTVHMHIAHELSNMYPNRFTKIMGYDVQICSAI